MARTASFLLAYCFLLSLLCLFTTATPVDLSNDEKLNHVNKRQTLAPVRGAPLSSMLTSSRLAPIRGPALSSALTSTASTLAPVRPTTTSSSRSSSSTTSRSSSTTSRSSSSTRSSSTTRSSPTTASATATRTSSTSTRSSSSSSSSAAPSSTAPSSAFAANILQAHNAARSTHGGRALTWSSNAESLARTWAEKCVWQHGGAPNLGQNLAASAGYRQTGQQAVDAWMDEESDYDPSNPTYSHFTQVVWKATTQVGCYQATCDRLVNPDGSETFPGYSPSFFIVCNYSPPGNVAGQYAENVQKNN